MCVWLSQPSYTSSSVTSGSCSSTSDSITTTTWNPGEAPQLLTHAASGNVWIHLRQRGLLFLFNFQVETLSTPTRGANPLPTTTAMSTRATQTRENASESST